jgi:hypothetical protein
MMLDLAIIGDGHCLKPTVRVLPDPSPPLRRGERVRAGIVEQQERADPRAKAFVGKQRSDRKNVSDPVPALAAVSPKNILHFQSPIGSAGAAATLAAYSELAFAVRDVALLNVHGRPGSYGKTPRVDFSDPIVACDVL